MLSGFFNSINHLMKYFLLHFIGYDFFNNKSHLNLRQIFLTELINNEEHRLENLEPEPEPGEPRLEILEA